MKKLNVVKLVIELQAERPGTWKWHQTTVRGTILQFAVLDNNFDRNRTWEFEIRQPENKAGYITVLPTRIPALKALAGLDRRSVNFAACHRMRYLGRVYHPIALQSVDGNGNFRRLARGARKLLPPWARRFRLRLKRTVTQAKGPDRNQQVIVVRRDDWNKMISAYFAEKVWPALTGYTLPS